MRAEKIVKLSTLTVCFMGLAVLAYWLFMDSVDLNTTDQPTQLSYISQQHQMLVDIHNRVRATEALFKQMTSCPRPDELSSRPPLQWNKALARAAQRQADWMAQQKQLSHGAPLKRRAKNVGYTYRAISENIAKTDSEPERMMQLWLKSPLHCINILNPEYRDIGVGSNNGYWTVILGREL